MFNKSKVSSIFKPPNQNCKLVLFVESLEILFATRALHVEEYNYPGPVAKLPYVKLLPHICCKSDKWFAYPSAPICFPQAQ